MIPARDFLLLKLMGKDVDNSHVSGSHKGYSMPFQSMHLCGAHSVWQNKVGAQQISMPAPWDESKTEVARSVSDTAKRELNAGGGSRHLLHDILMIHARRKAHPAA